MSLDESAAEIAERLCTEMVENQHLSDREVLGAIGLKDKIVEYVEEEKSVVLPLKVYCNICEEVLQKTRKPVEAVRTVETHLDHVGHSPRIIHDANRS